MREPISGKAVILAAEGKLNLEESLILHRVRLIPAKSIGGERLLTGFLPDRVTWKDRELDAVIAVDREAEGYGGCDGIIPEILLL